MPTFNETPTPTPPHAQDAPPPGRWRQWWVSLPDVVRKTLVSVTAAMLLCIGGVLIVVPGPFTLPFVAAALAVLASEFVWAERLFLRSKEVGTATMGAIKRVPLWLTIPAAVLVVAAAAAIGYYIFLT